MGGKGYNVNSVSKNEKHQYFFESVHVNSGDVVYKAIEYTPIGDMQNNPERPVFNLGFGDYNKDIEEINDEAITNNGDHYAVFNTVLHSIPAFFEKFPDCIVMVGGSDSKPEYEELCRKTCRKRCTEVCKHRGRRIKTYCAYVSKHYDKLSEAKLICF